MCVDEQEVLLGKASSTPLPCTGHRSACNTLLPSSRHRLSILLPVLPSAEEDGVLQILCLE